MVSFLWNRGLLLECYLNVEISAIRVKRFKIVAKYLIILLLILGVRVSWSIFNVLELNHGQNSLIILIELCLIYDFDFLEVFFNLCWSSQFLIKFYFKCCIAVHFHFEAHRFVCFKNELGKLFFLFNLKITWCIL